MTNDNYCTILYSMKATTVIVPIFNQSVPGVWEDFAAIRADAMRRDYPSSLPSQDNMKALWEREWKLYRNSFAFAAYRGGKMVGFVRGWCQNGVASLENLFVLRRAQGRGIGVRLMNHAEKTAAIHARRIELRALQFARTFYTNRMGYTAVGMTPEHNLFEKPLRRGGDLIPVSVFNVSPTIASQCATLSMDYDFDASDIRRNHRPLAIVMGTDARVRGFAIAGDNPDTDVIKTAPIGLSNIQNNLAAWLNNYHKYTR